MQLTRAQLRRFGITPDTNLGQHFLVDDNVLGVIERLAELRPDDVCYEPGVGVGVLTDHLARRVAHVHAVELDRRLQPAIDAMRADLDNVTVHWADAVRMRPAELRPLPNKLVSNLPYSVAAPIVAEVVQRAPAIRHACVMVQQEVADRFFANEGSKAYGYLSVLLRAACERTGHHRVARSVFVPPPNVDSTLVAFRRRADLLADDEIAPFAGVVRHAFRHRRKTLANNLREPYGREAVVEALRDVGLGPAARPEELAPDQFVRVWRELGASRTA